MVSEPVSDELRSCFQINVTVPRCWAPPWPRHTPPHTHSGWTFCNLFLQKGAPCCLSSCGDCLHNRSPSGIFDFLAWTPAPHLWRSPVFPVISFHCDQPSAGCSVWFAAATRFLNSAFCLGKQTPSGIHNVCEVAQDNLLLSFSLALFLSLAIFVALFLCGMLTLIFLKAKGSGISVSPSQCGLHIPGIPFYFNVALILGRPSSRLVKRH